MGTPDNPEEYVRFEVGDVVVYVARQLLDKLEPRARQMSFYIDGYGRYLLVFDKPWGGER